MRPGAGLRHLVAWSLREKRSFSLQDLPRLLEEGTGVSVRAVYDRWLAPMESTTR